MPDQLANDKHKALAESLCARAASLDAARATWDSFWQELARYVMPRKSQITYRNDYPGTDRESQLFDATAVEANMVLANGQLSWMTPSETPWFSFDPPAYLEGDDDAKQWYKRCTEIVQLELARSNFYSEIHELYLDRGAFGTACIFVQEGKSNLLNFECFNVGEYSLAEDDEGLVDTLFRNLRMSARAAVKRFGGDNVSEAVQKAAKDPKKEDEKFDFLHAIYPRSDREIGKADGMNMPWASVYVDKYQKGQKICREGGFQEKPFMATRYLKWNSEVYGWCPAWVAYPEARQLNFLEKQLDALAELAAYPRMLIPEHLKGAVDYRAAGVTYYSDPTMMPKEWATQGRYDIGVDRANHRRTVIEKAFHVDLFRMFASLEKQMTAREVAERSSEKLIQFSPTFARMTTELFNPLLERVFAILARAGAFPPPPESIVRGGGIDTPEVTYTSRIALAIKALQNSAFARSLEMFAPVASFRPDIFDSLDLDRILRDTARNDGMPAEWLLPEDQVVAIRQQRAEAEAAAAQQQQAMVAADAAAKLGKVPADSPMLQLVGQ